MLSLLRNPLLQGKRRRRVKMPIASLILDDCKEVLEYKEGLEYKIFPMECYLIKQPENKVLLIVVMPIFYVLEWAIFNPVFRWVMCKGLKRLKYKGLVRPISRIEVVRILLEFTLHT